MDFISISSQVSYGNVGNAAVTAGLQALGFATAAIPSVHLSCHPGLGRPVRQPISADYIAASLDQIATKGWGDDLCGALTGYFTEPDQVAAAAHGIRQLKTRNPGLIYLCDPVLGDGHTGLYIPLETATAIRDLLLPLADITTPNIFELGWLMKQQFTGYKDTALAARDLAADTCVVTSVPAISADKIATMLVDDQGVALVETPLRKTVAHGTGDLFAGLFLGDLSLTGDNRRALAQSMGRLENVISNSNEQILDLAGGLAMTTVPQAIRQLDD